MTTQQKKEALQNSLNYFGFDKRYFINTCDGRLGNKFAIAEELEYGGITNITDFFTYKDFNTWLKGFQFHKQNFTK